MSLFALIIRDFMFCLCISITSCSWFPFRSTLIFSSVFLLCLFFVSPIDVPLLHYFFCIFDFALTMNIYAVRSVIQERSYASLRRCRQSPQTRISQWCLSALIKVMAVFLLMNRISMFLAPTIHNVLLKLRCIPRKLVVGPLFAKEAISTQY